MAMVLTVTIPLDMTDLLRDTPEEFQEQAAIQYASDLIVRKVEQDILIKQLTTLASVDLPDKLKDAVMKTYNAELLTIRNAIPDIEYKLEVNKD